MQCQNQSAYVTLVYWLSRLIPMQTLVCYCANATISTPCDGEREAGVCTGLGAFVADGVGGACPGTSAGPGAPA